MDVFIFCDERLKNIKSVGDKEVESLWNEKLSARFEKAKAVKGTQTFHFVEPITGTTKVLVKEVSSDVKKFEKKKKHAFIPLKLISPMKSLRC